MKTKDSKMAARIKSLIDFGYSRKLAKAIAKYPRERWTAVREFGDRRRAEIKGGAT